MAYNGAKFHSFCEFADRVPIIVASGISKRFMVPGWRLGWIIVHDPSDSLNKRLSSGLVKMSMRIGRLILIVTNTTL